MIEHIENAVRRQTQQAQGLARICGIFLLHHGAGGLDDVPKQPAWSFDHVEPAETARLQHTPA
jgi:hypothetical protein